MLTELLMWNERERTAVLNALSCHVAGVGSLSGFTNSLKDNDKGNYHRYPSKEQYNDKGQYILKRFCGKTTDIFAIHGERAICALQMLTELLMWNERERTAVLNALSCTLDHQHQVTL
jgi:hypothetical protein